eukprot:CAMPEP_0114420776 /NCGR_PEP_ID=MMETSP0103-20121206/4732_1 /TAXON_ID=37642 ORGANISM="Paraphysomonas imperforata, Strain PA2" /NCGR_SAMPLE_ID=MMETSP0103 /ASSEMBLY_ACC=CAM_ASM_000201 /LENGTH=44 /DNA_ID= /DNA_START= /DNA_END= /DNA_ORIENTATION=
MTTNAPSAQAGNMKPNMECVDVSPSPALEDELPPPLVEPPSSAT